MKLKLSKRWITNLSIYLLSGLILAIALLMSLRLWYASADTYIPDIGVSYPVPQNLFETNLPEYQINRNIAAYPILEVYNQNAVRQAFGETSRVYPAYKIDVPIFTADGSSQYQGYVGIMPLGPAYDLSNLNFANFQPTSDSPAMQLLNFTKGAIGNNQSSDLQLINTSIELYNRAIIAASKNYVIDQNRLYSIDPRFQTATIDYPLDVRNETYFPGRSTVGWSKSVDVSAGASYYNPVNNSLALQVLSSARDNATSYGTDEERTIIGNAISRYQNQIGSSTTNQGLTINAVEDLENGGDTTISYSVNFNALGIASDKFFKHLILNIQDTTVCDLNYANVDAYGEVTSPLPINPSPCTWNHSSKSGTFRWNSQTPTVNTVAHGAKTVVVKAFDDAGTMVSSVSKVVTILPPTGDVTTPGTGVVTSVTVPASVDKSNADAARNVEIKVSGQNLNPNGASTNGECKAGNVCKFEIYICPETPQAHTDSTGCQRKEMYGPFQQNSFTNKVTKWDASGTAPGSYFAQVKVFGAPSGGVYPDYPSATNPTKVSSSSITVVENMGDGDDDGVVGPGPVTPGWTANFRQSAINTVEQLLGRIGWFTLTILAIFAVIGIIIAGMKYITSGGDSKAAETGKKALLFSIYGIIIAVLCIMLVEVTYNEVTGILGQRLQNPTEPGTLLFRGFGGPNASVTSIIGHNPSNPNDPGTNGLIWRVILLAVYYAQAVAVFYILYASFLYITSQGDEGKSESAKKTLVWAVIGLAFVISANLILVLFADIIA